VIVGRGMGSSSLAFSRVSWPRLFLGVAVATILATCTAKHEVTSIFGVAMGDPLSSLSKLKLEKSAPLSSWYAFEPTVPNSAFSQCEAFVTSKRGVCGIYAESTDANDSGRSIGADEFRVLLNAMTEKYGKPIVGSNGFSGEFARNNYSWNKVRRSNVPPPNTVAGIALAYDPDAKLPNMISSILLSYFPSDEATEVSYVFVNWNDCVKDAQSAGL